MQLLSAKRQNSGEFIFQQVMPQRSGHASFLTSVFHKVV